MLVALHGEKMTHTEQKVQLGAVCDPGPIRQYATAIPMIRSHVGSLQALKLTIHGDAAGPQQATE